MTSLANLRVFTTYPHPCSYLPGQEATTLFVDPDALVDQSLYSDLSTIGFRRSGQHLYRPHCGHCKACIPARIPVGRFSPRRSQRKLWRRNQDLIVKTLDNIDNEQCYTLYTRYIESRHQDGDMYPAERAQYDSFLSSEWGCTRYFGFYDGEELVAVAVADLLDCGISAIYTYYNPDLPRRSLGSYAILWQIDYAKRHGLPALYLGYWIQSCRKMSYKVDYRPVELFQNGRWFLYR